MNTISERLFSWRQILIYTAAFVGFTIAAQRILRYVSANWVEFDLPFYWPISVFSPRFPTITEVCIAVGVFIAFVLAIRYLATKNFTIRLSSLFGVILIAGLTMIHGIDIGYYAPVASDAQSGVLVPYSLEGQEYYHDAIKITDPVDFVRRYNEIQPTLHRHSHTHPPGAVLTFYVLNQVFRDPAIIGIAIMILSLVSSLFFFYKLARSQMTDETSRYMAFLFVLLPVVQIYYLASLDALITALLTGVLYLFCFGEKRHSIFSAVLLLATSFFLTFVSLFILPVLVGFELLVKRSLKRSLAVIGGVAAFYVIFYLLTGYNAYQSFRTASLFENPYGFMLFVDPVNYLFTRLEDVAEILFFLGPFLAILFYRGIKGSIRFKDIESSPLIVLTVLGIGTLLAMYAVGAWRTGETARAGAFIYPYLLFPVGLYLEANKASASARFQLAMLVFTQSIGMQLFGSYHW